MKLAWAKSCLERRQLRQLWLTVFQGTSQGAAALAFKEKNGKLYTRLLLETSDCPEGYSNAASQVV